MKYLGKRMVYGLVKELLGYSDMPKCIDCTYKAYGGYEWLSFYTSTKRVRFTVYKSGVWMRVIEEDEYGKVVDKVLQKMPVSSCSVD